MVSVIVPVYNIEQFIGNCIASIIVQTYRDLEIILVDDGSTDRSGAVCDQYALEDGRITVIHKVNGGLVSARKTGLEAARGEYVACVDGDDWLEPDAVERMLDMGCQADIICFAAYEEYRSGRQGTKRNTVSEGLYRKEGGLSELYGRMLMNGNFFEMGVLPYQWGKLIKTGLLRKCQEKVPDGISYAEDVACIYPCMLQAESVFISNVPVYHYRIQSCSMVNKEVRVEELQSVFSVLQEAFEGHIVEKALNRQLEYYKWQSLLLKGYSYIKKGMPLFPFVRVKPEMQIAVYGAGLFGRVIYQYCRESEDLHVAGWFDKEYDSYVRQGLEVRSSSDVRETEFDMLIIAILNVNLAKKIKDGYVRQGIPEDKIDYVHVETFGQLSV